MAPDLGSAANATIPRLSVLVGKGGVGRSTLAAAMGLVASRRGLRALVLEVSARQVVPEMLGVPARGYEAAPLAPGLWGARVSWEEALQEYGLMKLHVRALYRVVFENPFVRRLLPAVPGIHEIVVIGKIVYAAMEGIPGLGTFDTVILDAPATGHGRALLNAPRVVAETVPVGPMAEDARWLQSVLSDPSFTRFHLVTTPEEMPVAEAEELYASLGGAEGFPFGPMFVNQVQDRGLQPEGREALALLGVGKQRPTGACATAAAALFMSARHEMQRAHVARLRGHVPLPLVKLPDLRGPRSPRERLDVLADHLDAVLWREVRG